MRIINSAIINIFMRVGQLIISPAYSIFDCCLDPMSLTWPWHFTPVSAPDKQQRRELLDLRGYVAQFSVLVVICAIRIYQSYFKATEGAVKQRFRRRDQPWWDRPPFPGWTETRKQYAVCLIWLGWLSGLSALKTGDGR